MSPIFIEKNKRIVWTHFNQIQTATMTLNTSCHQSHKRSVFMALVATILIDCVEKLSAAHLVSESLPIVLKLVLIKDR